jgi:hypothetical protein
VQSYPKASHLLFLFILYCLYPISLLLSFPAVCLSNFLRLPRYILPAKLMMFHYSARMFTSPLATWFLMCILAFAEVALFPFLCAYLIDKPHSLISHSSHPVLLQPFVFIVVLVVARGSREILPSWQIGGMIPLTSFNVTASFLDALSTGSASLRYSIIIIVSCNPLQPAINELSISSQQISNSTIYQLFPLMDPRRNAIVYQAGHFWRSLSACLKVVDGRKAVLFQRYNGFYRERIDCMSYILPFQQVTSADSKDESAKKRQPYARYGQELCASLSFPSPLSVFLFLFLV